MGPSGGLDVRQKGKRSLENPDFPLEKQVFLGRQQPERREARGIVPFAFALRVVCSGFRGGFPFKPERRTSKTDAPISDVTGKNATCGKTPCQGCEVEKPKCSE